jgi:hypothetical protein
MPDTAPDVSADQLIQMLEHQQGLVDRLDRLAEGQIALIPRPSAAATTSPRDTATGFHGSWTTSVTGSRGS